MGRDVRPDQLDGIISSLEDWLGISDDLLSSIQSQLDWASQTTHAKLLHKQEVEEKIKEVKKNIRVSVHTFLLPLLIPKRKCTKTNSHPVCFFTTD